MEISKIENAHKQEMCEYVKSAIYYLELAMNVIECDDKFNDGQSEKLNKIYDKVTEAKGILESV